MKRQTSASPSVFRTVLLLTAALFSSAPGRASIIENVGVWSVEWMQTTDSTSYTKNFTAAEQSAIKNTLLSWDNLIGNTPGRQVDLRLGWSALGAGVLGSASGMYLKDSNHVYTGTERVWRDGLSLSPEYFGYNYDAAITFGTAFSWYTGSGTPSGSEIDLSSVMLHEIGHTLGFFSTYNNATDLWSSDGISIWDSYLRDATGNQPAKGSTGVPSDFAAINSTNPVTFTGTAATAVNGGSSPFVFTSTGSSYMGGSSLSHVNYINDPMYYAIGYGQVRRTPSALDLAILKDLGWTIVPEPAMAMLLLVSGTVLLRSRQRRPPGSGH